MSRHFSHISSARQILKLYKGDEPFVHFIRKYFSINKKFGSKDRKTISNLCYHYFRTAGALAGKSGDDKLLYAIFLCEHSSNDMLQEFLPDLNAKITLPVEEKIGIAGIRVEDFFPLNSELSAGIDTKKFNLSMLVQPSLFLRSRPGKSPLVEDKLSTAGIPFEKRSDDCFELQNAAKLDDVITLNRQAVIQDLSSQKVLDYLKDNPIAVAKGGALSVWDCCAASGGKSILVYDRIGGRIKLTVSDIRKNILVNCKQRLREAGINIQHDFIANLGGEVPAELAEEFDIIICDAPCSGSGTWGRSPEQLQHFDAVAISTYQARQQKIALNAISRLKTKGLFFYITCSVFKRENEDVTKYIAAHSPVTLLHEQYYKGYDCKADTLYVSVFTK